MTGSRLQQRIDELFVAAIERPELQRAEFLANATQNDPPEIRRMVMELLAADERAHTNFAARSPLNLQDLTADDIQDPRIGQRIDDYVIGSRIASGGFGIVYQATRETPYVEDVAVKMLHRESLAAPHVVRRVLREMQALSDLRHPNIVTQLHSGVTDEGEPFIVMEYIDGRPLDAYCDQEQLSIDQRLRVFQNVCRAVQFAHEHGWVHRDLKPSNILVTDDGVPKLLDFGIAKLSSAKQPGRGETLTDDLVGTPQYMSPEQFAGQTSSPATDVYALGAILYELISGHRVFDVMCRGIDAVLIEAVQGAIRRTVPRRPSILVVSDEKSPTGVTKEKVADQRRLSPAGLKRCLEGDIDNIAMMALRKEPARRYETAAAVADDIQCWLDNRPVAARPESVTYRARKFARRNRQTILIGLVVALCLLSAVIAIDRGRRASSTRDVERAQRYIESAQKFLDDEDIPRAIVDLYAAQQTAPASSDLRDAASRLLAGWGQHLGVPLGFQANLRYVFDPSGRRLAVARPDGTVAAFDTSRLRQLGEFLPEGRVTCLAWSNDGQRLLTVTRQGIAQCWNVLGGIEILEPTNVGTTLAARLCKDQALMVVSEAETLRVFAWAYGGTSVRELARRSVPDELIQAEFANDHTIVVARRLGDRRQVDLLNAHSLELLQTIKDCEHALGPRRVSADGSVIAQGFRGPSGYRVSLFDGRTDSAAEIPGKPLDISENGRRILTNQDRQLRLYHTGGKAGPLHAWEGQMSGPWDAAFASDASINVAELGTLRHTVVRSISLEHQNLTTSQRLPHPFSPQTPHAMDRVKFGPHGRFLLFDNRFDGEPNDRIPWLWAVQPFLDESMELEGEPHCLCIENDLVVAATESSLWCWNRSTARHARIPAGSAAGSCGRRDRGEVRPRRRASAPGCRRARGAPSRPVGPHRAAASCRPEASGSSSRQRPCRRHRPRDRSHRTARATGCRGASGRCGRRRSCGGPFVSRR